MITIDQIKKLRAETGISVSECKKALEKANGDIEKAKEILRKLGANVAEKKSAREVHQGIIESYIHPNKRVGVLLEIRCETDFVARSSDFKNLAHELCLQIAAMKPLFIKESDIPQDVIDKEKEIYLEQLKDSGKPKEIIEKIIQGKLEKYKEEKVLFLQPWIKDESKKVKDLVNEYIAKLGENITISKFARYEI